MRKVRPRTRPIWPWLLAFSVGSAAIGWVARRATVSRTEAALQQEPPPAAAILAAVERRVMQSELIVRGTVDFEAPREISVAGPLATEPDAAGSIITKLAAPGSPVNGGAPSQRYRADPSWPSPATCRRIDGYD